MSADYTLSDREVLRPLAARAHEIALHPEMPERRRRLRNLNALRPERPLVLCLPGPWTEILPEEKLECRTPKLRRWEMTLRQRIIWWEQFRGDIAFEPYFNLYWQIAPRDYGVELQMHHPEDHGGSYNWTPVMEDIERDFHKLREPEFSVDRDATHADLELAASLFGDLLPVRLRGRAVWGTRQTQLAILFLGLEAFLTAPYDQPEGLHRLMKWLGDQHLRFLEWLESENLLTYHNEDDHIGSGGFAYSDELPDEPHPNAPARLRDTWGFAESQETVGCSPEMFAEFVLPYMVPIMEKYGLNAFGCCEPLHDRLDALMAQVPRLRRVSISPWCDQRIAAEKLGKRVIFSRKPHPMLVSLSFNEEAIRKDLAETLAIAGDCALEIIMKDLQTLQSEPWRLTRWLELAREEVDKHLNRS